LFGEYMTLGELTRNQEVDQIEKVILSEIEWCRGKEKEGVGPIPQQGGEFVARTLLVSHVVGLVNDDEVEERPGGLQLGELVADP